MTTPWGNIGTWTEERLKLLRELFDQGLTASMIAARIHVSRNAVIGKVHRLGLDRRGLPPRPKATQKAARSAKPAPARPKVNGFAAVNAVRRAERLKASPGLPEHSEPDPIAHDNVVPMSQRLSLLELNEATCHWPIGDPSNPEFFFCGGKALAGLPYCAGHCRRAFQPVSEPVRRRPQSKPTHRGGGGADAEF
jgi:GcrA cell cycle regulator